MSAARATAPFWLTPLELTALSAIWGASFLFMRVAAQDFGPIALIGVRVALGAVILLPFLWRDRAFFTVRMQWKMVLIGALNAAVPFTLFAWGAERAPASIGAITNSMTVMFTALIAFILYREEIGLRQGLGLLVGFVGVVVLVSGKSAGSGVSAAVAAGLCGAVCFGFGINLARRQLAGIPSSGAAAATLLGATVVLAPFAIGTWPSHPIQARSWVSALLLGIVCTGAAFVLYYRLINRIGAARTATVTYLIPLFAVLWAWFALGEPLTPNMAISGVLILGGVALSQQKAKPARTEPAASRAAT